MKKYIKKLLVVALMLFSVNAYAGMWSLVHSEFVGNGWMCTYQLQGSGYVSTIFSKSYCTAFIYQ